MTPTRIRRSVALLLIPLCAAALPEGASAQSKVGTTAAQFLGIPVGPRAIAMGGAYVAAKEDVSLLYWNPGAIVQADANEFQFVNTDWLVGTKFRWFGLVLNLDGENAIGASVTDMDYGDGEVTTVADPEGTGESWSAADLAVALSYSRRLTDKFSIGGTVKYINLRVYNETASTVAFDAGLLYDTDISGLRIGMSMSNFGGDVTLSGRDLLQRVDTDPNDAGSNKTLVASLKTDPWPLPLLFRVGVAMDVVKNDDMSATVAMDALRPSDDFESINVGGEIGWRNILFVRGGYESIVKGGQAPLSSDKGQEGLTLGAGLKYHFEGVAGLAFNYSFQKFGLFGNLNTIALSIGF